MKHIRLIFSIISIVTVSSGIMNAQVILQKAAISSGGSLASNSSVRADVTIGQPVTGTSSNSNTKAEMGFWTAEAATSGVSRTVGMNLAVEVWPNPVSALATASVALAHASHLDVCLYDLSGKKVKSVFSGYASNGINSLIIDLTGMASGSYILAASIPGQLVESRVVLMRAQ